MENTISVFINVLILAKLIVLIILGKVLEANNGNQDLPYFNNSEFTPFVKSFGQILKSDEFKVWWIIIHVSNIDRLN